MRKAKKKVVRSRKATPRSAGKKTRCIAKTKAGKQCKRFATGTSRTCSVHRK